MAYRLILLISVILVSGCGSNYFSLFENRSDKTVVLDGESNPKGGNSLAPRTTRSVKWNDICQPVLVDGERAYLDTRKAPMDSIIPGRGATSPTFQVMFDGEKFYYYVSEKKKYIINSRQAC